MILIIEENFVGIDVVFSTLTLSALRNTHNAPQNPLFENMASSTKNGSI